MLQKLFGYAILLVTALWLILSYVPASVVTMPQISYHTVGNGRVFQVLLAGGFLIFVVLQIWLVYATKRLFHTTGGGEKEMAVEFGLNRTSELFWTAIPLLMTMGLALASYQTWTMLSSVK